MISYKVICLDANDNEVKVQSFSNKKDVDKFINENLGYNGVVKIDTTTHDTMRERRILEKDIRDLEAKISFYKNDLNALKAKLNNLTK